MTFAVDYFGILEVNREKTATSEVETRCIGNGGLLFTQKLNVRRENRRLIAKQCGDSKEATILLSFKKYI